MVNYGVLMLLRQIEVRMPHSISTNRTATFQFDVNELRELLTAKASEYAGPPESGFSRKVTLKPLFTVLHGQATLQGLELVLEDSKTNALAVGTSLPPSNIVALSKTLAGEESLILRSAGPTSRKPERSRDDP